jgi:hypothetical protein
MRGLLERGIALEGTKKLNANKVITRQSDVEALSIASTGLSLLLNSTTPSIDSLQRNWINGITVGVDACALHRFLVMLAALDPPFMGTCHASYITRF